MDINQVRSALRSGNVVLSGGRIVPRSNDARTNPLGGYGGNGTLTRYMTSGRERGML